LESFEKIFISNQSLYDQMMKKKSFFTDQKGSKQENDCFLERQSATRATQHPFSAMMIFIRFSHESKIQSRKPQITAYPMSPETQKIKTSSVHRV
jgi:hypothetical protein